MQPLSGALGSSSVAVSAPPRIAVAAAELQDVVSFSLGFRGSTYLIELQAIDRTASLRTSQRSFPYESPMSCLRVDAARAQPGIPLS